MRPYPVDIRPACDLQRNIYKRPERGRPFHCRTQFRDVGDLNAFTSRQSCKIYTLAAVICTIGP